MRKGAGMKPGERDRERAEKIYEILDEYRSYILWLERDDPKSHFEPFLETEDAISKIESLIAEEREECAKVAEKRFRDNPSMFYVYCGEEVAKAIRSRGSND